MKRFVREEIDSIIYDYQNNMSVTDIATKYNRSNGVIRDILKREIVFVSSRINDLTGKMFSRWFVIEQNHKTENGETMWLCECQCESKTRRIISTGALKSGNRKSCGCLRKETSYVKDLTGMTFGRLIVIEFARLNKSGNAMWLCECSCDKNTRKTIASGNLVSGTTQSCGCLAKEKISERKLIDIEGQIINNWRIIERAESNGVGSAKWVCECLCEMKTRRILYSWDIRNGKPTSCGCDKHSENVSQGMLFGKLEVLKLIKCNNQGDRQWLCRCNCVKKTEKIYSEYKLLRQKVQSCGCLRKEKTFYTLIYVYVGI